eukprot:CAMPEP_0182588274 /NCGR_PEP_ID=MMETSP1324-20130603/66810_1 /TAXON_ID=236786 /ORGANISM="Florenciella sp., Strain RCC1587" /LENGTH=62 /DNA_ID=CAMNT_0024805325 /DNA_START=51 /DNA_END=236 /DNA_ORIENTATION=-
MTSTWAGMGPHLPRVPTSLSTDATSPLHFQFPPKMYLREPVEDFSHGKVMPRKPQSERRDSS